MELALGELQSLVARLITSTEGVNPQLQRDSPARDKIEKIIHGDERLGAVERLQIYATAYFHRLLESLTEDYPVTLAVIGEEEFRALVAAYLAAHPSNSPSVFGVGRSLPDFIVRYPEVMPWPFLGDLARLERTLIEIFHAADAPPLTATELQHIPPERWDELRLYPHPAVAILDCEWRVDELLDLAGTGDPIATPERRATAILVWRQDNEVYRRRLEPVERIALGLIREEATFGAVCEAVAPQLGADTVREINAMLARWLRDGILRSSTSQKT
jgi:hypothetical protein